MARERVGKRGTRSWGESRRPTRSASSFSASPSANPVSTRKRTATPVMPQPDRAWWDDVQYLREPLERKREKEARRGLRLDARAAARAVAERHASAPAAEPELDFIHGLDSVHELAAMPRTRRFGRPGGEGEAAPRRLRFGRSPERRARLARGERDASL